MSSSLPEWFTRLLARAVGAARVAPSTEGQRRDQIAAIIREDIRTLDIPDEFADALSQEIHNARHLRRLAAAPPILRALSAMQSAAAANRSNCHDAVMVEPLGLDSWSGNMALVAMADTDGISVYFSGPSQRWTVPVRSAVDIHTVAVKLRAFADTIDRVTNEADSAESR